MNHCTLSVTHRIHKIFIDAADDFSEVESKKPSAIGKVMKGNLLSHFTHLG